ncbi:hypothetical protein [Candidatus Epulonipiscium viviparus]|uniref:hypothetical protein n=1 Tax=Candidatus Epulonipiscium viviparus TaxID=420336 RepID=UPI00273807AD|nr:hypothetical protein [Candidatus Epulopiscium viviparus]
MQAKKIKTHHLDKCYSIAPLEYLGKKHILVAAEKINRCLMFDLDGNLEDTIWEEPGGTMSMVQVPNSDGVFLATHKFYSPNDSKEAKIMVVSPSADGWNIQVLAELPHVHRFDIISRDGQNYLVAATLCSGRDFKDDWAHKGKVYATKLPDDLSAYNKDNQLPLDVIQDELLKNHGYFRGSENGYDYCVVGTEDGIYKIVPPAVVGAKFEIIQLLDSPASDMTLVDLDNDGELEMVVFSPFHGSNLDVYKLVDGKYSKFWSFDKPFEFAHALWSGKINGQPVAILGHREGNKQLIALSMTAGAIEISVLDDATGVANTFAYQNNDKTYIVSANREIDEIAFYEVI